MIVQWKRISARAGKRTGKCFFLNVPSRAAAAMCFTYIEIVSAMSCDLIGTVDRKGHDGPVYRGSQGGLGQVKSSRGTLLSMVADLCTLLQFNLLVVNG